MQKNKTNPNKQDDNIQKKLNNAAVPLLDENQNHNHNTKKVSLGPNTKR